MKNKKLPLSPEQQRLLACLVQDWHLLVRSTRASRTTECSRKGISNREMARAIGVDEKTIRQDLKFNQLPELQQLQIDRGAAAAPFLVAKQIVENRTAMLATNREPTTKGMSSNGLLELLRSFSEKVPKDFFRGVIWESRRQIFVFATPWLLSKSILGLTPETIIARTEPDPQEPTSSGLLNFWSEWILRWTLALVPDRKFVDDALEALLGDVDKVRLAA